MCRIPQMEVSFTIHQDYSELVPGCPEWKGLNGGEEGGRELCECCRNKELEVMHAL